MMVTLRSTLAVSPASSLILTVIGTSPGLAVEGDWTSTFTSAVAPDFTGVLEICFWSNDGWKNTCQSAPGEVADSPKVLSLPVLLAMVALNSNLPPLAPLRVG